MLLRILSIGSTLNVITDSGFTPINKEGPMRSIKLLAALLIAGLSMTSVEAFAFNAQKTLKKQGCLKCHAISRKKDGPSIKEIAVKYRKEEDGTQKLREHLTSAPVIEIEGKKEKHKQFKAKSPDDLDAVIEWILSK
jgi:cytochrome c